MSEFNQLNYINDWKKANREIIRFEVKKGSKSKIAEHAKSSGYKSVTEYLHHLICQDMQIEEL